MADERKPQDEPKDERVESEELSEEELDHIAGGFECIPLGISNLEKTTYSEIKNPVDNVR